ncbi:MULTISPECIES: hypothetical protein [Bacillus]|uniref:hypothetical protein n=1 Tax=Bacillus TaxID=1386 RepID=UPI0001A19855|nr:hypothetical protein [Bacillus pseudomycoides]EEM13747.1 hypothetical protein bpmyx0001_53660 [Bacillus pseudomycoides DSM 12442]MED1594197.1 hypothetical protein [Bacillus pseudomycoides]MED4714691.1 hypothetical protein [Bacillus pseudomycoides]OOR49492.1 hypothetical protein BLX05_23835 [Bacillus pseudomycoides]PDY14087.1 hypothetical protein COO16_04405 [Bacillus pseudomycoides]
MNTKECYSSPDITNWLIGTGIYLILGLVVAVTVYVTHRNSQRRPSLWILFIINCLWLIFLIIWVSSIIKQKIKQKKTYSIEEMENELHEDDRFVYENGEFQQVVMNCKYCKSESNLDYDVIVVYDEDGNEKFSIAFWECDTCRNSHIID